jgi:ubiquinol-cytochrome c reductase cytochrome c1 subunit
MRNLLVALSFLPFAAALSAAFSVHASEAGYRLDRSRIDSNDMLSLQAGARTFVNYCLNCHGAQYMRYNRLTDIGLTEKQILDNLVFTGAKVGETMKVSLSVADGKAMFGAAPPDLSVIARARSTDWLYTYLRTFYRDSKSPTGWNNAAFPQVAMPHALWDLQGPRTTTIETIATETDKETKKFTGFSMTTVVLDQNGFRTEEKKLLPKGKDYHPGTQITFESPPNSDRARIAYDTTVRDLVNFLDYVAEPAANSRKRIGIVVLFFLGFLFIFAYALKKEYWKDVK